MLLLMRFERGRELNKSTIEFLIDLCHKMIMYGRGSRQITYSELHEILLQIKKREFKDDNFSH